MQVNLMRAVWSSLLRRGMLLGKSPRDLQAESWSIQGSGLVLTALLRSGRKYIRVLHWVDVHVRCPYVRALQGIICPGKLSMRTLVRNASLVCLIVISTCNARRGLAQFGIPGLGGKSGQSNDQKANQLLHQHLPLVLDANNAYPTVPDQNMLGGPFHPRTLPITWDTLTKPLPPGDYVLPMTFFCSEYSVHRGGNGIAYQLGPAQGTAAKAISTLLWRGMLTGHKPQELQSVSWAIQGSVAYDKMPPKYKALVDQLIPDMKNQVNGQAFADIEDGFQGKVNKITKKISEGIGKGTGGFVHADIKVDVELNQSFQRLGQVGRSALDGEKLNTIFTAAFPSDEARDQALYAGQGQQTAALPAANGPWSVKVPGVAYMRFMVHGGNLQGDNVMQIRILPPRTSQARVDERPHLILAGYEQNQQSTPSSPSVISLFNGSVNEAALSQCQATPVNQQMCMAQAISVSGDTGYSIGTGAQAPIMAPTAPITTSAPTSHKICVKKVLYEPTVLPYDNGGKKGTSVGLCIYLAVVKDSDNSGSCSSSEPVDVADDKQINWVQTYRTTDDQCTPGVAHKDHCDKERPADSTSADIKKHGPMYRSSGEERASDRDSFYTSRNPEFHAWNTGLANLGNLQMLFRDIPQRPDNHTSAQLKVCRRDATNAQCLWSWHTAYDNGDTDYRNPNKPVSYSPSASAYDNELRLVSYSDDSNDPNHFQYTPLLRLRYGLSVNWLTRMVTVSPLQLIGSINANDPAAPVMSDVGSQDDYIKATLATGGTISIDQIAAITTRAPACRSVDKDHLGLPPINISRFPYP